MNPALNALQSVRVSALPPSLGITSAGAKVTTSWGNDASGFVLESAALLRTPLTWSTVNGVANPLAGAGSLELTPGGSTQFFRLRK